MRLEVVLGPKAEVPLSDAQRADLGGGVRIPVVGSINGTPFRTTVFRMHGFTGIAFRKELQQAAGVFPGDSVVLELERDTEERTIEEPAELAAALDADPVARNAFDKLSFTHRREYAEWVAEAKRPRTRDRRVAQTVERLNAGGSISAARPSPGSGGWVHG